MKQYKMRAVLSAVMMIFSMTACGEKPVQEPVNSTVTIDEILEIGGEKEQKAVQKALDGFLESCKNADYNSMLKYYDAELVYFLDREAKPEKEQLLQYLRNGEAGITPDEIMKMELGAPECVNSQVMSYNQFFATLDADSTGEKKVSDYYQIEGVYAVAMRNTQDENAAETPLCILKINGEWKCDVEVTLLMSLYHALSGISDDSKSAK